MPGGCTHQLGALVGAVAGEDERRLPGRDGHHWRVHQAQLHDACVEAPQRGRVVQADARGVAPAWEGGGGGDEQRPSHPWGVRGCPLAGGGGSPLLPPPHRRAHRCVPTPVCPRRRTSRRYPHLATPSGKGAPLFLRTLSGRRDTGRKLRPRWGQGLRCLQQVWGSRALRGLRCCPPRARAPELERACGGLWGQFSQRGGRGAPPADTLWGAPAPGQRGEGGTSACGSAQGA